MDKSGKTLTIFLVVFALLIISLTGIGIFFYLKEIELRKTAEYQLEQVRLIEAKLQSDLKEAQKQVSVLEGKNAESEDKIENLLEEVELEQGLRDALKKENRDLRETIDQEVQAKKELKDEMLTNLAQAEEKISALQEKVKEVESENAELEELYQKAQAEYQQIKGDEAEAMGSEEDVSLEEADVILDEIIVTPDGDQEGKIISVDHETDFIIVNMGEKDGILIGEVLSVFHDDDYMGDVKVSRVLPEMSAADFIPPLDGQKVQKDDRVIVKK